MSNQTHEHGRTEQNQQIETDGLRLAQYYLKTAVELLHEEGRLRPMFLDMTFTDADGSQVIGRVNVKKQGGDGAMVISHSLDGLTKGELFLTAGSALSLFAVMGPAATRGGIDMEGE